MWVVRQFVVDRFDYTFSRISTIHNNHQDALIAAINMRLAGSCDWYEIYYDANAKIPESTVQEPYPLDGI